MRILGRQWTRGGRAESDRARASASASSFKKPKSPIKRRSRKLWRVFRSFYRRGPSVSEVIAHVSLEEKSNDRVGRLSGGQKQRLAVACALVNDPDILFLDEPTTGLDPQARLNLWEVVEKFRSRGRTVLMTTHYMEEAARLCDRVAIMDHGKIIALGTPAELVESLGAHEVIEFNVNGADLQQEPVRTLPGVRDLLRATATIF